MKPVKHDTSRDGDPKEQPYVRGRIWMNEHPLREDWYAKSEDGLLLHGPGGKNHEESVQFHSLEEILGCGYPPPFGGENLLEVD